MVRHAFRGSSGPISVPSRRTTIRRAKPNSVSERWRRRWKGTWRCWPDCLQGPFPSPLSSLPAPLLAVRSSLVNNLVAGLEMSYLRQDRDRFGPAEGVLPSQAAHYYLLSRFPQHHVFAATDLERYASCPFRFFLERVSGIEPAEDLTLEFDVRNRGRVVHDVLATFHRRVNERFGRLASPLELDVAEFDALLAAAVEDSLPPEPENPLAAALREVDRRLVIEWLWRYRERCEDCAVASGAR